MSRTDWKMPTITLVVDSREPDGVVQPLVASKQATVAQLLLGDFHYLDEQGHVKLIIERKAISDLAASIVDGRYRDQRRRLAESQIPFIYIFEGRITNNESVKEAALLGSLINMALLYRIGYIQTDSPRQTVDVVTSILAKMSQGTLTLADVPAMAPDTLPTKKHLRAKHLFANQLALVPGLTLKKAKAIAVRYPTFKSLIDAFEKDGQDCLYSLGLVGKTSSRKIYESLAC